MARQSIATDLLTELRSVHSGLHAALDALLKQYDPNECGRILVAIDERLTGAINRLAASSATPSDAALRPAATTHLAPAQNTGAKPSDDAEKFSEPLRRLHETWMASVAPALVDQAAEESGRRLRVILKDDGIEIVSPGVTLPVGSIRAEVVTSTLWHFQPEIVGGATLPSAAPADLEEWALMVAQRWRDVVRTAQQRVPPAEQTIVVGPMRPTPPSAASKDDPEK